MKKQAITTVYEENPNMLRAAEGREILYHLAKNCVVLSVIKIPSSLNLHFSLPHTNHLT